MCIAYLAIGADPQWPLFIAANRDEYHSRPTRAAAPWRDHPDVIAGLDLQAGGTWLGLTRQGRFALLTNYRDTQPLQANAPSRGELVRRYLTEQTAPEQYMLQLAATQHLYNGFNLIAGNLSAAFYLGNRSPSVAPQPLLSGRYVLSNHLLDTPWPKAERLRLALDTFPLQELGASLTPVFDILKDNTQACDTTLPDTGLPLERERLLSSPFIINPRYGTRCSTVIAIHASGDALFSEVSYDADGIETERHDWPFVISAAPIQH
jgi:uncharacterized protein with NRDE domain